MYQEHYRNIDFQKEKCFAGYTLPREPILETRTWKYKTMVTAMDKSIGMLLNTLAELGIENDTLVIFTSDNGPERGAGSPGLYREGKRSLMEGGIRVPTFMQWIGVIPPKTVYEQYAIHTDLAPTFLDLGGAIRPPGVLFDGISLVPLIKPRKHHYHSNHTVSTLLQGGFPLLYSGGVGKRWGQERGVFNQRNRVILWHRNTEKYDGADEHVNSAGYYDGLMVIQKSGIDGCVYRLFDMYVDNYQKYNMIEPSSHERYDRTDWKNNQLVLVRGGGPRIDTCGKLTILNSGD